MHRNAVKVPFLRRYSPSQIRRMTDEQCKKLTEQAIAQQLKRSFKQELEEVAAWVKIEVAAGTIDFNKTLCNL